MPVDWVAAIAGAALSGAAGPVLGDAWAAARDKVRQVVTPGGPLARPLKRALEDACQAFIGCAAKTLRADPQTDADLRQMMADEPFLNALRQLPFVPFPRIDVEPCRERFLRLLGPRGMQEEDFDAAWQYLGLEFRTAVAGSQPLKNVLDLFVRLGIRRHEQRPSPDLRWPG